MKTENKICYMSEVGHKNFQYPTSKKMILQSECSYQKLPWVCGRSDMMAVKVKIDCVVPLSFDKDPAYDILVSNNKDRDIVVWIDKE